jgi:GNAT superfamily N-acetyltransferase
LDKIWPQAIPLMRTEKVLLRGGWSAAANFVQTPAKRQSMVSIDVLLLYKTAPHLLEAYAKLQSPFLKTNPKGIDLEDPKNHTLFAVGATNEGGEPVGLILARMLPSIKVGEIQSVFVAEPFRRQNIGSRMLSFAAEQLASLNFMALLAMYPDRVAETPLIEEFFKKNGFKDKQLAFAEFVFEYSRFTPDWFLQDPKWPEEFQVFPWTELSYAEALEIKMKHEQQTVPDDVYPFAYDCPFDSLNSLGLRYKGQIIGWMITQRTAPDAICYAQLFIDFEFQMKGYAVSLLVEALKIHYKHQVKWGLFKVNIMKSSSQWLKFVRYRLAPSADFIYEYYQTYRPLGAGQILSKLQLEHP